MPCERAWAWLGDMELDDTLLGLGAAGLFATPPCAIGFVVNAAHCAQVEDGKLKATAMYHEKRTFLDTFFGSCFFSVVDKYHSAGKPRGSIGQLKEAELAALGPACGLVDEFSMWVAAVAQVQAQTLHLLISGPLVGRGEELCKALVSQVLGQSDSSRIVVWMYAGSFNITHSSPQDLQCLRKLAEDYKSRVCFVETTLKSGAWLCDPPEAFWGPSCPTAWSLGAAKTNPVGYDVSTDIQSVNMFFERYSSQSSSKPGKGLRWICEQIAEAEGSDDGAVARLLRSLQVRSLVTNLTKMVQPDSGSMQKLRETLAIPQTELETAFKLATDLMEKAVQEAEAPGKCMGQEAAEAFTKAASRYAELYRGSGDFLEAGCIECFPSERPFSGPRLDKRCILRCMAQGALQGGPTADVLILLALLLNFEKLKNGAGEVALIEGKEEAADAPVCCNLFSDVSSNPASVKLQSLPESCQALFQLKPSAEGDLPALSAVLKPTEMNEQTKARLAPLVDRALEAIVSGAAILRKSGTSASWGVSASCREST